MKRIIYPILLLILVILKVAFNIDIIGSKTVKNDIAERLEIDEFQLPGKNVDVIYDETTASLDLDLLLVNISNISKDYNEYISHLDKTLVESGYTKDEDKIGFSTINDLNVYIRHVENREILFYFYYDRLNNEYDIGVYKIWKPHDATQTDDYFTERRGVPTYIILKEFKSISGEDLKLDERIKICKSANIEINDNNTKFSFECDVNNQRSNSTINDDYFLKLIDLNKSLSEGYYKTIVENNKSKRQYKTKYTKVNIGENSSSITNINYTLNCKYKNEIYDYHFIFEYEKEDKNIGEYDIWPSDVINDELCNSLVDIPNYQGNFIYGIYQYNKSSQVSDLTYTMFEYDENDLNDWINVLKESGFSESNDIYEKDIITKNSGGDSFIYDSTIKINKQYNYVEIIFTYGFSLGKTNAYRIKTKVLEVFGEEIGALLPIIETDIMPTFEEDTNKLIMHFSKTTDEEIITYYGYNTYLKQAGYIVNMQDDWVYRTDDKRIVVSIDTKTRNKVTITITIKDK